jgi:predicted Ser/Thr protein kinase
MVASTPWSAHRRTVYDIRMSMMSAACAKAHNEKVEEWENKLRRALKRRDWAQVEKLLKEIEQFRFSE